MSDLVLSLLVLGALAMCAGAWFAWRRGDPKRAALMLVAGAVMAANVAIWTIPGPDRAGDQPTLAQEARDTD